MTRDELQAIEGITDAQINAVMAIHGRDTQAWQGERQGLQAQLDTATQGLAAFGQTTPETVAQMQQQITQLQQQMTDQQAAFAFEGVLRTAAQDAGAVSADDVIALLPGKDALRASQNQTADVAAALAQLKVKKPYLFTAAPAEPAQPSEPQPAAGDKGPGIVVPKPRPAAGSDPKLKDFLDMSGIQRMELRAKNPALFAALMQDLQKARG